MEKDCFCSFHSSLTLCDYHVKFAMKPLKYAIILTFSFNAVKVVTMLYFLQQPKEAMNAKQITSRSGNRCGHSVGTFDE